MAFDPRDRQAGDKSPFQAFVKPHNRLIGTGFSGRFDLSLDRSEGMH
ncbi:hypothetical protein [Dongia deserti]|nr:hypothetical protein [Dongia deserti]